MTDFADIPAVGDALVEEIEEDEEVELAEELEGDGKYRFNCKHIYVTWSKSKIDSSEEFYRKLLTILPAGVRMFGGREFHQDRTPHYYMVFFLLKRSIGGTQRSGLRSKEIRTRFGSRSQGPDSGPAIFWRTRWRIAPKMATRSERDRR